MKMSEKLQEIKKDNKGFSLVELIIVIAIMAILIGIVGMNVIPQIENANKATDAQVLSAFVSEAMEAWTQAAHAAEDVQIPLTISSGVLSLGAKSAVVCSTDATGEAVYDKLAELENNATRKLKSKASKSIPSADLVIHCSTTDGVYIGVNGGNKGQIEGFEDYEFRSR